MRIPFADRLPKEHTTRSEGFNKANEQKEEVKLFGENKGKDGNLDIKVLCVTRREYDE